jgi:hypothetical protein
MMTLGFVGRLCSTATLLRGNEEAMILVKVCRILI